MRVEKHRAKVNSRSKILNAARELFWEQGYEATSLADVAHRAGVRLGSVYYFFRTKEDLLLGVLDLYTELLAQVLIEPLFARVEDPIERIFGLLDGYRKALVQTQFSYGCPIGNLAIEVATKLPRARKKIAANFEGWRSWVRRCLVDARDRLSPEIDIQGMAILILAIMEGAVMQSRVHQSLAPFDASVKQLRDYFHRLERGGKSGGLKSKKKEKLR